MQLINRCKIAGIFDNNHDLMNFVKKKDLMKIITFITCILTSTILYAQEPSIAETINWLNSKIDKREKGDTFCKDVYEVYDDKIVMRRIMNSTEAWQTITLKFKDIDTAIVYHSKLNIITFGDKVLGSFDHEDERHHNSYSHSFCIDFDFDEPNLQSRLIKAFNRIAEENRKNRQNEAY